MERRIGYWGHVVSRGYRRGWVEWATPNKNKWYIDVGWEGLFAMRFPEFKENNGFKWDEYEKLKREALDEFFSEEETKYKRLTPFLCHTVHNLRNAGKGIKEIEEITGMSRPTVYHYLRMKDPLEGRGGSNA